MRLRVRLRQQAGEGRTLGRFRLSFSSSKTPIRVLPVDVAAALRVPASERSAVHVKALLKDKLKLQKEYEQKQREKDPNAFYRFKREQAETKPLINDGVHDPEADLWYADVAELPFERGSALNPVACYGDRIYVFGGISLLSDDYRVSNTTLTFDPKSGDIDFRTRPRPDE